MGEPAAATSLYDDCVTYRIHVIVIPVISGDPNYNYSELTAYLMYKLTPYCTDMIVEYQKGARVPWKPMPDPEPEPPPPLDYLFKVRVIAYHLNVRNGPGSRFSVVTTVDLNALLIVFDVASGWYAINTEKTHWIYGYYTVRVD